MNASTPDHSRYRELLGASLLGELQPEERAELARHLAGCPECRAESELLGETADRLGGGGAEPPPDLEDRVVERVLGDAPETAPNAAPSRLKYVLPAAAMLVVLIGAVAVFPSVFGFDGGTPGLGETEEISFSGSPQGVVPEGSVIAHTWGTEVVMEVSGLEDGEVYTVSVVRGDGSEVEGGTFIGVGANEIDCEMNAAVLRQDARAVLVTDSEGRQVLRSELERRPADLYT